MLECCFRNWMICLDLFVLCSCAVVMLWEAWFEERLSGLSLTTNSECVMG